jgi:hypothetical protein
MMLRTMINRIYEDYLMPSRLPEYERLIKASLDRGYRHMTILEFFYAVRENKLHDNEKIFLHRHDIDTDRSTARAMFDIEKRLGIKSSFYFRLSTMDYPLMKEIAAYGSEASYHYEELAQFCKDEGIKSKEEVLKRLPELQEKFERNFREIESVAGYKLRSVASHGDFVNRRLGITNSVIVDERIRSRLGIELETYDPVIVDRYSARLSDTTYPSFYKPYSPFEAIGKDLPVVYLLTHPRHWRKNIFVNSADNLQRLYEGIRYKLA